MLPVLIVEDDHNSAELLKEMIKGLYDDIHILGIIDNVDEAIEFIHKHKPKILFLDINIDIRSGFEIIRKTNSDNYVTIVTTAYSEHAIEAIKNQAVDFILKPYEFEELRLAVEKARKALVIKDQLNNNTANPLEKISIHTNEGIMLLNKADITYIKAFSNYSDIKLNTGETIVASKVLSSFEEILRNDQFFRVHKSYLVNLKEIKKYQKGRGGNVTMNDNSIIPVSVSKKHELLEMLDIL